MAGPYVTTAKEDEMARLKERQLCVISFYADPDIAVVSSSVVGAVLRKATEKKEWEEQLSRQIAQEHLTNVVSQFQEEFTVVGTTEFTSVNSPVALTDKARIADAIEEAGADAGLIVYDQYGWMWGAGEAGISQYQVETRASILSRDADLIWDFHSEATIRPKPSLKDIISGFFATTPDDATIIDGYSEFLGHYPAVIVQLIEEDIAGEPHGETLEDYVGKRGFLSTITLRSRTE